MLACGGTISQDQFLNSPGYPSNYYGNNLRCSWVLEKQGNYKITIEFTYFFTENRYDYVEVYDYVNGVESKMNNRRYTGSLPRFSLTSTGSKMRVYFLSDYSVSRRGFSAKVTFGKIPYFFC